MQARQGEIERSTGKKKKKKKNKDTGGCGRKTKKRQSPEKGFQFQFTEDQYLQRQKGKAA